MSAKILAMATKKATKRPRAAAGPETPSGPRGGEDAVQLIATALASHESSIRQLAEVVVNLHENIRAIREVLDALTEGVLTRGSSQRSCACGE